jgi:hypothetical protein
MQITTRSFRKGIMSCKVADMRLTAEQLVKHIGARAPSANSMERVHKKFATGQTAAACMPVLAGSAFMANY